MSLPAGHVLLSFATRAATIGCSVLVMILAARWLGPTGKGEYAYVMAVIGLGLQFGNLGLGTANLYFASRDPARSGELVGTTLLVSAVVSLVVLLAMVLVGGVVPRALPYSLMTMLAIAAAVLAGLCWNLGQNVLIGAGLIGRYNLVSLGYSVILAGGLSSVFLLGSVVPGRASVVQAVCGVMGFGALCMALRKISPVDFSFPAERLRGVLKFGVTVYIAQTFSYLLMKCDFLIVQYNLSSVQVGWYTLAGDFFGVVVQFQAVMNLLFFPALARARTERERRSMTTRILVRALVVYGALLSFGYLLLVPIVRLAFGEAFVPAADAISLLMPGALLLALGSILQNHLGGTGRPSRMIWAPAAGFFASLFLNLYLVPTRGIVGAAVSSSLACGLMFLVAGWLVYRPVATDPVAA